MVRNIRLVPFALFIAMLALSACRTKRTIVVKANNTSSPDVIAEADTNAPFPNEAVLVAEDEMAPAAGGDDGAGADDYANDAANRSAVEADRTRFLVRQKLEAARRHIDNYEYAEAEKLLLQARALQPGNRDVANELRIVQDLRGDRSASAENYVRDRGMVARVKRDEQKAKAAKLATVGRSKLMKGDFDDAIDAFEQALFIIEASPYEIEWGGLKTEAENGLRESRYMKDQQANRQRRETIEKSLEEMARAEEQALWAEMQRLEAWMGAAVEAFQREDFDTAISNAERILDVQPDNTKARELQMAATRAGREQIDRQYLIDEKLRFREWLDDITATRIPQQRIVKWPSQSFWERITAARSRSRPSFGEVAVDTEGEALKKKIAGMSVNLSVENEEFQSVVATLRIQTGLNIVIDNRAAGDIAEASVVGLVLQDVALDTALNLLQTQAGEEAVWITKGNVVMFTMKEHVKTNLVTQIHSVADLTSGLTDFIPPQIQLVGPDDAGDEENPLFGGESEEPRYPYGQVSELIELIKGAVDPSFWETTDGADIVEQGEHAIVVKASAPVQEQVDQFLNDLRGFAGIVVTVETRFLEVGDFFLRDVGVDFRGLGGTAPTGVSTGTLANLDDVTNGLEDATSAGFDNGGTGLAGGAALNPSSGVYFNDGGDGDFRARTENIFDNPLGSVLSSLGGTTLTLKYLDDTEFQMIIRATEKAADTRTLTAPRITVYNTQRANLTVVNQLSYIQDFDVEVAQTSFIADPIVGIIQDGLTLDVRPTVSNDRRYITLELQPTVADLVEPIPTFATTLASSFTPVIIQLPELRLQQARTTVRIPDKGSILIGGLKNIRTVDRASETPLLGKLPLLSFLFSRKGRSDEVSHLMILVRAEITDLREQEENLMGR